jgi:hypothetical protein
MMIKFYLCLIVFEEFDELSDLMENGANNVIFLFLVTLGLLVEVIFEVLKW